MQQPGASTATSGDATFTYDTLNRLTSWVAPFAESNGAQRSAYTLDDAGNITQELTTTCATPCTSGTTMSDTVSSYSNGQLRRMDISTPTSDPGVNDVTCIQPSYSDLGQEASRVKRYHAQLDIFCTPVAGDYEQRFTSYDPFGNSDRMETDSHRLNAVATSTDTQGQVILDWYDGAQRLIRRLSQPTVGDVSLGGQDTIYFYFAGTNTLVEETDGAGQTMVRYLNDDQGQPVAQESYRNPDGTRNSTATWSWFIPDTAGNIGTITDDSGGVLEQAAYDPYGTPKQGGAGSAADSPGSSLGFQTALTEKTTGTVLLGNRQYDPEIRRFTTVPHAFVAGGDPFADPDPYATSRHGEAGVDPTSGRPWLLRVGWDTATAWGRDPYNNGNFGVEHVRVQRVGNSQLGWPTEDQAAFEIKLTLSLGTPDDDPQNPRAYQYKYTLADGDRVVVVAEFSKNTPDRRSLGLRTAWKNRRTKERPCVPYPPFGGPPPKAPGEEIPKPGEEPIEVAPSGAPVKWPCLQL